MRRLPLLLALALVALLPPAAARADEEEATYARLLELRAGALVAVRVVLTVRYSYGGSTEEQEQTITTMGVVVDAAGVVMLPKEAVGEGLDEEIGEGDKGYEMKATPTGVKVIFPGDTKEYDAFVGAIDTKLGLSFVMVKDLGEKKPVWVDLAQGAEPRLGQRVYGVSRLDQGFDYAPHVRPLRVGGVVRQPRAMWLVEDADANLGEPLYDAEGRPLGVVITQRSVSEDSGEGTFLVPLATALPTVRSAVEASRTERDRMREEERKKAAEAGEGK